MASSDERIEVAQELRENATKRGVTLDYLGSEQVASWWLLLHSIGCDSNSQDVAFNLLADLIDPTCHPVPSDGGFFTCSECGERIGAVLPALGTVLMHHCSHCGARVVSGGGELHGITGTEIGKYRHVSDNEDGKEG